MTTARRPDPAGHPDRTPETWELNREIADTRDALAETLSALLYKTDVRARARDRIVGTRARVRAALPHRHGTRRRRTAEVQHPHESWHGIEAVRPRSGAVLLGLVAAGVGAAVVVAVLLRRGRCCS